MNIENSIRATLKMVRSLFFRTDDITVTLIISTGRTGTESVADLFQSLYPTKVLSLHEPRPDLLNVSVQSRKYGWSNFRTSLQVKSARTSYLRECKSRKIAFYIESNNNLSFLLPALKKAFKKIKVIYFTRDPETFLISEMNKRHGKNGFLLFSDSDIRERITPLVLSDGFEARWHSMTRAQKIAWYWRACNNEIINNISGLEVFMVKFEDFFDSQKTSDILDKIIKFTGLPYPEDKSAISVVMAKRSNSSKHNEFLGLSELEPNERAFYEEVVGDLRTHLGYSRNSKKYS